MARFRPRPTFGPQSFACIGDSHTFNLSYLTEPEYWPALVAGRLGWPYINASVSGNSSGQVYSRRRLLVAKDLPHKAVIYVGTNDLNAAPVVAASPVPSSTVFAIDTGEGYYVADSWITVGGVSAQIASISSKTITLTAALAGGAPSAGAAVRLDTQKNIEKTVAYLKAQGMAAADIYVCGQHYLNFTSSGDTTTVEQTLAHTTRLAQAAAATAQGVTFIDLYAYMRALILSCAYTQGSASWHIANQNSHLNAIGQQILADAIYAAVGP